MRALEASVVYTDGISSRVGGLRFRRGVPVTVSDPALIEYLQNTGGFNVTITKHAPEKKVRKVRRDEDGEPVKKAPAKKVAAKKKPTKKTTK